MTEYIVFRHGMSEAGFGTGGFVRVVDAISKQDALRKALKKTYKKKVSGEFVAVRMSESKSWDDVMR